MRDLATIGKFFGVLVSGGIIIAAIATTVTTFNRLDNRVTNLEKEVARLEKLRRPPSARAQNCVEIVNQLTDAARDSDTIARLNLLEVADKFGCADFEFTSFKPAEKKAE